MKEYDTEDPFALVGVAVSGGEPQQLIEAVVQEYLMLGWTPKQIGFLFQKPFFAGTFRLREELGADLVDGIVERICKEWAQGWENAQKGVSNA